MTHEQVKEELGRLIECERENTNKMLAMLTIAEEQKSYLEFGYNILFNWLTEGFKYANGSAQRRLNAINVMLSVPQVQQSLLNGELNLTTLSRAQTIFNAQEKATGSALTNEAKAEAIKQIESKSEDEAHQALLEQFPEAATEPAQPKKKRLNKNLTRYPMLLTNEEMAIFRRVKEVLSHKFPRGEDGKVLKHLGDFFLNKEDPLRKRTSAAELNRIKDGQPSKAHGKREKYQEADGQCVFVDASGHRCTCRWQVQNDHQVPLGIGGEDSGENFRPLSRKHNILMAERVYGKEHMARFKKGSARFRRRPQATENLSFPGWN